MTFTDVISLIGTLVGIAAVIGGLMTYILKQNPNSKQIALVSVGIVIALVCVIILAEVISYLSTRSTFAQIQKTATTLVPETVHVFPTATVHSFSAGVITEFPLPNSHRIPSAITAGPDGNIWFTEVNGIGRISPSGNLTEFSLQASDKPVGITTGPDGNLWFTDNEINSSNSTMSVNIIGRISPGGALTEFPLPNSNSRLQAITVGPDGNLWFTVDKLNGMFPSFNKGEIGRISPSGTFTEFFLPSSNSGAYGITAGSDGNLWFTENVINSRNFNISESKIGRISL